MLKKIRLINLNTLRFNFHYFSFSDALKFRVLVSGNVSLKKLGGKVILNNPSLKTGQITIGYGDVGIFDKKFSRTIWQVDGTVTFNGTAAIGHGSKLSVQKDAILSLGKNLKISAETSIIAAHRVEIGDDCLIAWDVLIMDTDLHFITDFDNAIKNAPQPVVIGSKVWIGCRCLILKGANVAANSVIAANSTVSKPLLDEHTVYGGNNHAKLKSNINWFDKM